MQSYASLGRALYRVALRGGSPQRIHFTGGRTAAAAAAFVLLGILSQHFTFSRNPLEIGLFLFTTLSGLYIAAAWSTRRVPRSRLRTTLLAVLLIAAASQGLLLAAAPFGQLAAAVPLAAAALVALVTVAATANCVQYALATTRRSAAVRTLLFAAVLIAFYVTLASLLEIVFS